MLVQSLTASLTLSDNPVGPHAATRTRCLVSHSPAIRRTVDCTSGRPGTAYGGRVASSASVMDVDLTASILGLGNRGAFSTAAWVASFSACDSDILVMCTRTLTRGCAFKTTSSGTKPASWAVDDVSRAPVSHDGLLDLPAVLTLQMKSRLFLLSPSCFFAQSTANANVNVAPLPPANSTTLSYLVMLGTQPYAPSIPVRTMRPGFSQAALNRSFVNPLRADITNSTGSRLTMVKG